MQWGGGGVGWLISVKKNKKKKKEIYIYIYIYSSFCFMAGRVQNVQ